jgi:peptidyl-prolyl cis-trans isomerase D
MAEVKAEIVAEIRREAGTKKYSEAAEAFGNMVYEQADSLKPAAEKWKLELRGRPSGSLRDGKVPAALRQQETGHALFGDDAVKNKRNTEAVEIAPGDAGVGKRFWSTSRPPCSRWKTVKTDIEKRLIREEAAKLAIKDGEEKLAMLAKGRERSS